MCATTTTNANGALCLVRERRPALFSASVAGDAGEGQHRLPSWQRCRALGGRRLSSAKKNLTTSLQVLQVHSKTLSRTHDSHNRQARTTASNNRSRRPHRSRRRIRSQKADGRIREHRGARREDHPHHLPTPSPPPPVAPAAPPAGVRQGRNARIKKLRAHRLPRASLAGRAVRTWVRIAVGGS